MPINSPTSEHHTPWLDTRKKTYPPAPKSVSLRAAAWRRGNPVGHRSGSRHHHPKKPRLLSGTSPPPPSSRAASRRRGDPGATDPDLAITSSYNSDNRAESPPAAIGSINGPQRPMSALRRPIHFGYIPSRRPPTEGAGEDGTMRPFPDMLPRIGAMVLNLMIFCLCASVASAQNQSGGLPSPQ